MKKSYLTERNDQCEVYEKEALGDRPSPLGGDAQWKPVVDAQAHDGYAKCSVAGVPLLRSSY